MQKFAVAVLVLCPLWLAACNGAPGTVGGAENISSDPPQILNLQPVETLEPEDTLAAEQVVRETLSQTNAVRVARDYIAILPFSRQGLIEQLQFEGFSIDDATYAVDTLNVDWKEQAAKAAEQYLNLMGFSRHGLIEQLIFEGFTREEAEYAAEAVGF